MKYSMKSVLLAVVYLISPLALAENGVSKEVADRIFEAIGAPAEVIRKSPVPGFVQVEAPQGPLYVSEDGKFLFTGTLYGNVPGKGLVDLRAAADNPRRKAIIEDVPVEDQIVFPAKGETKAHIYVFTDVDCGYCRKLHAEVPALNASGVEVRYLAYTRELSDPTIMSDARSGGTQGGTYKKMVSAWCAKDRLAAMTQLKTRGAFDGDACDEHPVIEQYQLGGQLGVRGTPAIILQDGSFVSGYRPSKDLISMLGLDPQ